MNKKYCVVCLKKRFLGQFVSLFMLMILCNLQVSNKFNFVLFADDTNYIFYPNRNYEFEENTVNSELDKVMY